MTEEEYLLNLIFDRKFRDHENYILNQNKNIERTKLWQANHPDYYKQYRQTERGKDVCRRGNTKYYLKRIKEDSSFKLLVSLRKRIHIALKRNTKSGHTLQLIGCSIDYLKSHLEKQFTKGMSWSNWGIGEGKWNIDHIRPCSNFDLSKPEEQRKCFNYSNLQPLWALDNILKSNR
jgi:hypothetical protein